MAAKTPKVKISKIVEDVLDAPITVADAATAAVGDMLESDESGNLSRYALYAILAVGVVYVLSRKPATDAETRTQADAGPVDALTYFGKSR